MTSLLHRLQKFKNKTFLSMKNLFNFMLVAFMMIVMGFSFTGCTKESAGKIRGLYLRIDKYGGRDGGQRAWGLDFVNGNTVKYYDRLHDYKHWDDEHGKWSESLGYGNWYFQSGCDERATYYIEDNKIYIPMKGIILTIEGDNLYPDGSGTPYVKQ